MNWRKAVPEDSGVLAPMNACLIRDEGHRNQMTHEELVERMDRWLRSGYEAVLFEENEELVAYSLYRRDEDGGIYLRQFFVKREHRRRGAGRSAIRILATEVWPPGARITIEVLTHNAPGRSFWRAVGFRDYAVVMERVEVAAAN